VIYEFIPVFLSEEMYFYRLLDIVGMYSLNFLQEVNGNKRKYAEAAARFAKSAFYQISFVLSNDPIRDMDPRYRELQIPVF
jgi:hypothetical protein